MEDGCEPGETETNYVPYIIGGLILVIVVVVFVHYNKKHDKEMAELKRKYTSLPGSKV